MKIIIFSLFVCIGTLSCVKESLVVDELNQMCNDHGLLDLRSADGSLYPEFVEQGWLKFIDNDQYESFIDYIELIENHSGYGYEYIDSIFNADYSGYFSYRDLLRANSGEGSVSEHILFPQDHLNIGLSSMAMTSVINSQGIVQVGDDVFVFRGKTIL